MEKPLPMIFFAILCFSGFPGISQAQNGFSADEIDEADKIVEVDKSDELDKIDQLDQNVNNMLRMLEELENEGGMKEKLKVTGEEKNKLQEPDPMDQFIKPDKKLGEAHSSPQKNKTKNNIETADEVVRFVPDDPNSHFRLGLDFWRSKNLDEAIKHFKEVVRLDFENAHAYWNLGLIYEEKKDDLQAIHYMKQAEAIYLKYKYPMYARQAQKHLENLSRKKNAPRASALLSN